MTVLRVEGCVSSSSVEEFVPVSMSINCSGEESHVRSCSVSENVESDSELERSVEEFGSGRQ